MVWARPRLAWRESNYKEKGYDSSPWPAPGTAGWLLPAGPETCPFPLSVSPPAAPVPPPYWPAPGSADERDACPQSTAVSELFAEGD